MPSRNGKVKGRNKVPRNISAALLPTIAFTAVPSTPPPTIPAKELEPKFTKSLLGSSIISRVFATKDPPNEVVSEEETTTSMNDYLEREPGRSVTMRSSTGARSSKTLSGNRWSRRSEGPYDCAEEVDDEDDDAQQHVYAQARPMRREVREQDISPDAIRVQEAANPSGGRHQFKFAEGLQGSNSFRRDLPSKPMLENVGTLMATEKDTQEAEDLQRMVSLMRENEEDNQEETISVSAKETTLKVSQNDATDHDVSSPTADFESPEPVALRRDVAMASSHAPDVNRSSQVSARLLGDRSDNERMLRHLKDEVEILKRTIQRLNAELARQVSTPARSTSPTSRSLSLPSKGPVPAWLVNMKFLSPLLVAYDEKLQEKEGIIQEFDRQLKDFEASVKEVVRENEKLHMRLEEAASQGPTSRTEWQQFLEQAKLVLEENQLLLEQLDVQQEKGKAAHQAHLQEVSRLSKQMINVEAQRDDFENELFRVKQRFRDLKSRYDQLLNEKEHQEDDVTTEIYKAKVAMEELKTAHERESKELMQRLEDAQNERRSVSEEFADVTAERKRLDGEVRGLKKSLKDAHRKNLMLRKLLQKEQTAQEYLESVLQMANSLAEERDGCLKAIKEKDVEYNKAIQTLVDEVRVKASVEANKKVSKGDGSTRKNPKAKSLAKLESIVQQLLEQNEDLKKKAKEYEREVIYLQSMVKEKEGAVDVAQTEKRVLEEQLESVWQAAVRDNNHLRGQIIDTM